MSTYKPQVGDRVRVVIEGEVTYTNGDGFDIEEGPFFASGAPEVVSVEKIASPLPTTPGSVIRYCGGYYARTRGGWRSLDTGGLYPHAEFDGTDDSAEVLFDAGQVTS